METLQTVDTFRPLTKEEERILEMYSRGESYEIIQENLLIEYGRNYPGKKLGQKMGEIKKKMRCETQFQMGYLYARRECMDIVDEEQTISKNLIEKAREQGRIEGYRSGVKHDVNSFSKANSKSFNEGAVAASLFWLLMIAIVSHYVL